MADQGAVILLSGGLDSTVCATLAAAKHGPENVAGVTVHYGQMHVVEMEAACEVGKYLGITVDEVQLDPDLFAGGQSALLGETDMPEATYQELAESEGVSPTYVPYRNGNLLSAATAYAMTAGATEMWAGMHAEDARGWAYPDCTPEFLGAQANAIYVGSYHKVRLVTPLMWDTKADVVRRGLDAGAPLHLTHSCYRGRRSACGTCPTCVGRLEAFRLNGVDDPIVYQFDEEAAA